jgi:hypothetical protein
VQVYVVIRIVIQYEGSGCDRCSRFIPASIVTREMFLATIDINPGNTQPTDGPRAIGNTRLISTEVDVCVDNDLPAATEIIGVREA